MGLAGIIYRKWLSMLTLIMGPMYVGKTEELEKRILQYQGGNILIVDFYNSRNTPRELTNRVMNYPEKPVNKVWTYVDAYNKMKDCNLIVVDEVHLACVFHEELLMKRFLLEALQLGKIVLVGGLISDCYNSQQVFPIWWDLLPLADEVLVKKSCNPCQICGSTENVGFTIPDRSSKEFQEKTKIGDHYKTVCMACKDKD